MSAFKKGLLNIYNRAIRSSIDIARHGARRFDRLELSLEGKLRIPPLMPVRLPVSGREVMLELRGEMGRKIYIDGLSGYESTTTPLWGSCCKKADIVIDVGAHIGLFSLIAADANSSSKIISFEPLPDNFVSLCSNIERGSYKDRISPYQIGMSNQSGIMDMLIKGSSGSTLETDFWEDSESLKRIGVSVTTLDMWLLEHSIEVTENSLVKIDVETHEPEVLAGAKQTLAKRPVIFCEVLATFVEQELNDLLPSSIWRYFWIGPNGPSERKRIAGDPDWEYMNYVWLMYEQCAKRPKWQ